MTDVTGCDFYAKINSTLNSEADICSWRPKRMGEVSRICQTCGAEYEPKSRAQKYCCKECRPSERNKK